jgi:hypothetical protein
MQLQIGVDNWGDVQVSLSVYYTIRFGSQGNRTSETFTKSIPIQQVPLQRK